MRNINDYKRLDKILSARNGTKVVKADTGLKFSQDFINYYNKTNLTDKIPPFYENSSQDLKLKWTIAYMQYLRKQFQPNNDVFTPKPINVVPSDAVAAPPQPTTAGQNPNQPVATPQSLTTQSQAKPKETVEPPVVESVPQQPKPNPAIDPYNGAALQTAAPATSPTGAVAAPAVKSTTTTGATTSTTTPAANPTAGKFSPFKSQDEEGGKELTGDDLNKKSGIMNALKNPNVALAAYGTVKGVLNTINSFIPDKTNTENMGAELASNIALKQGLDSAYDAVSDTVALFKPVGTIVGGAMQVGKTIGKAFLAFTGSGTDSMTTTDALMDSPFLAFTPIGMINGWGGTKARSFQKDEQAIAQSGNSYHGTVERINDAMTKQGKKYGLFSSSARKSANEEIAEAERQQKLIRSITDESVEKRDYAAKMLLQNTSNYRTQTRGGYDAKYFRAARLGMKFKKPVFEFNVTTVPETKTFKFQIGGSVKQTFDISNNEPEFIFKLTPETKSEDLNYVMFLSTLPKNLQSQDSNYRMKRFWELKGKPKSFYEGIDKDMFTKLRDGWHAATVALNEDTGEYEFIKSPNHKTVWMEEAWYNGFEPYLINGMEDDGLREHYNLYPLKNRELEESEQFRKNYKLVKDDEYWKYVKRNPEKHKSGGKITSLLENNELNLMPIGALHKELHHIEDVDNITKKGIPVIDNYGNQQAEIECEEWIISLELTKFVEELYKKYYDNNYSQKEKDEFALIAGKELVYQLFNNTKDNDDFIKSIK